MRAVLFCFGVKLKDGSGHGVNLIIIVGPSLIEFNLIAGVTVVGFQLGL